MEVRFKYKGWTDGIQGVVFGKNGYSFNGSKIDRQFSYSKIAAALNRNSLQERQAQSCRQGISPASDGSGELISSLLGLLDLPPFILHRDSGESRIPPADATEEEKEEEQGI